MRGMSDETSVGEFIRSAIDIGQRGGIRSLPPLQRAIFLVSELEVLCDKDGIEAFMDSYDVSDLRLAAELLGSAGAKSIASGLIQIADSLPSRQEDVLSRVNDLVVNRAGYDYDELARVVAQLMG
jgi:hypothetical protein